MLDIISNTQLGKKRSKGCREHITISQLYTKTHTKLFNDFTAFSFSVQDSLEQQRLLHSHSNDPINTDVTISIFTQQLATNVDTLSKQTAA